MPVAFYGINKIKFSRNKKLNIKGYKQNEKNLYGSFSGACHRLRCTAGLRRKFGSVKLDMKEYERNDGGK